MIHCSANSSTCSGSKIVIEWSGTIVTVFNNAIFGWDRFGVWFKSVIIRGSIRGCRDGQKDESGNHFHIRYFSDIRSHLNVLKYDDDRKNPTVYIRSDRTYSLRPHDVHHQYYSAVYYTTRKELENIIKVQEKNISMGWYSNANHQKYREADGLGRWPYFSEKRHIWLHLTLIAP